MSQRSPILVVLVLALTGCDPSQVAEFGKSVADRAGQVTENLAVSDTHESLYGAMLRHDEEVCDILDGITDIPSAKDAAPRVATHARQYRHLAHRYLMLGLPDDAQFRNLLDKLRDREQKLAERKRRHLSESNKDLRFARALAAARMADAKSKFESQVASLKLEEARGQSRADELSPADLAKHEKALAAAAASLSKLTDSMSAATQSPSAASHLETIQAQANDFVRDVDQLVQLGPPRSVRDQIRLDPAREKLEDAVASYARATRSAADDAKNWHVLLPVDLQVTRAIQKLQTPQISSVAGNALPQAAGPLPGRLDTKRSPRPGDQSGFFAPPSRAPPSPPPASSAGEGAIMILIDNLPPGAHQKVTAHLATLVNSKNNYHANSKSGRYSFTAPAGDLQAIANKIDFGRVTHIDKTNRTITVHLTSVP